MVIERRDVAASSPYKFARICAKCESEYTVEKSVPCVRVLRIRFITARQMAPANAGIQGLRPPPSRGSWHSVETGAGLVKNSGTGIPARGWVKNRSTGIPARDRVKNTGRNACATLKPKPRCPSRHPPPPPSYARTLSLRHARHCSSGIHLRPGNSRMDSA